MCGHEILRSASGVLSSISDYLTVSKLRDLITILDACEICPGNPDKSFVEMGKSRKGKFLTNSGELRAELESTSPSETIRTTNCDILVKNGKCLHCSQYRSQLRMMVSRHKGKSAVPSKFSNERYLNTPQKIIKIKSLRERATAAESEVQKLTNLMNNLIQSDGVGISSDFHDDMLSVMNEHNDSINDQYPEASFRRLFWAEQFKVAKVSDPRQMRWHPTMIRWCLNLKLLSSSTYHCLRTSGFIKLPSERTLRDYTNFLKSKPGFQSEVDLMLVRESNLSTLPEWRKYVVVLFDEIKVRENLVYDKHSEEITGFVQLGEVNDAIQELEQNMSNDIHIPKVATHVLGVMVRGLFTNLKFPYAHFPTADLTGECLFTVLWEAIERLERLGFKVIGLTGDGASPNRKFFRLHSKLASDSDLINGVCYRTINPYADERYVYFFSDVPHLIKTTRNCWSHSNGKTRNMWVRLNTGVKLMLMTMNTYCRYEERI